FLFFSILRLPPRSPFFPYTTLFRSPETGVYFSVDFEAQAPTSPEDGPDIPNGYFDSGSSFNLNYNRPTYFGLESMPVVEKQVGRSEEHTSELQSLTNLVCRLLLEKK